MGLLSITSGWRMTVDEKDALVRANAVVEFPVGHASAQQVWRGLRSRPTWRILAYSAEEPPKRRAFVLIDAVDGRTIEHIVEDNPEDLTEWADVPAESAASTEDDTTETARPPDPPRRVTRAAPMSG